VVFDGVNDVILIPHHDDFVFQDGFTVTLWVRFEGLPPFAGCPVGKGFAGGMVNSWLLCVESASTAVFYSTNSVALRTSVFSPSTWHHFALRWDPAAEFDTLWIDDNIRAGGTAQALLTDEEPILIGADRDGGVFHQFVQGTIDEVRIYDRALSDAEIIALATPDS
jgi:hypothetical protein